MSSDRPHRETGLILQGVYFVVSGIWPVLHMRSFMAISGRKVDIWLVRTFGALVAVCGGAMLSAVARRRVTHEVRGLAVGTATALAISDVYYASKGRIPRTYLLDGISEFFFVAWGLWAWQQATADGAKAWSLQLPSSSEH